MNHSQNLDFEYQNHIDTGLKGLSKRVAKHAQIGWQNLSIPNVSSPPFLILFINSICNMKCEHCFYWQQLNQKNDLTFEEIVSLSEDLGTVENLNLSGGEPFLRKEFCCGLSTVHSPQ